MKNTFYITTPIYYPSDKLHIGHSYTTVAADTMARYKKQRGYDVKFLTGTDEHGQKIERKAKLAGITPKQYVDNIVVWIKELWKTLDIEYDYFLRTTDIQHEKTVQKIFKKLYDNGDIYKSKYSGLYCTPCETFFTDRQLDGGKCPDCGRPVETVDEESYFFRLSKYQQPLINHIESNPDFISPKSRQNEMINNFIKPGLEDLCVSRTSFTWGIPVEFDPGHVVYVWIDALSNYITALGYLSEDDSDYKKYWPADIHLVGKEIVRFHTIIWPAMLLALGEPLPKQVFGHGWLIIDGGKMSKSKGNVVDPKYLVDRYGVDAIRYFLMREVAFGQDGNFTNESLLQRINSDLANDLGNLVSRTSSMIEKYFEGSLDEEKQPLDEENDNSLISLAKNTLAEYTSAMDKLLFSDALTNVWALVRRTNKYIDENSPWILAKDAAKKPALCNCLYNLTESLRIITILITPFMPTTAKKIVSEFGYSEEAITFDSATNWGMSKNINIVKGGIIFPRIDIAKELEILSEILGNTSKEEQTEDKSITIEDFDKIELRAGCVLACEKIKGSDKLLKSQIKIGEETRQIVSGIAKYYTPEEMIGKSVVVVTNLKPVKLKGEMSYGMILAAKNADGKLVVINADGAESGADIS